MKVLVRTAKEDNYPIVGPREEFKYWFKAVIVVM